MTVPAGSPMTPRGAMVSILGKLIVELRTNAAVYAIVGNRVYGKSPGRDADDVAFVLVQRLGNVRATKMPFVSGRVLIDCYGRTGAGGAQEATNLYRAVSDALAGIGPRQSAGGVALFLTTEEVGGQALDDPDTGQPVERSIFAFSAPLAQAS